MNRGIIIFIVILGLIITGAVLVYFLYEKPIQEKPPLNNNLNIRIYDKDTGKQIVTNYIISMIPLNTIYKEGTTVENGFVKELLPVNNSFRVITKNKGEQTYYTNFKEYEDLNGVPMDYRIEIPVQKYGKLLVSSNDTWKVDNPYKLTLTTNDVVNHIGFCVRWSRNIISVTSVTNYEEELAPKRLENKVDRCYNTDISLNNESIDIFLNYKKFGELMTDDSIKVIIMDGDIRYTNPYKIIREGGNKSDIGVPDIVYEIKN